MCAYTRLQTIESKNFLAVKTSQTKHLVVSRVELRDDEYIFRQINRDSNGGVV